MLTVTDLVTYTFCPRRLYAIKRLGFREGKTREMVLGTVVHAAAELFTQELVGLPDDRVRGMKFSSKVLSRVLVKHKADLEATGWALMECFRTARPMIEGFARQQVETVLRLRRSGLPEVMRVEVPIESAKLGIRGRIDELRVTKEGVVPVELKTGKVPDEGVWHYHKVQLAAYALLLEGQGKSVPHAAVSYIACAEERHVGLNPFLRDEVLDLIRTCKKTVAQSAPPKEGCGECEACQVLSRSAGARVAAGDAVRVDDLP